MKVRCAPTRKFIAALCGRAPVDGELPTVIVMRSSCGKNGLGRSWLASPTLFGWLALRRVPWGGVAQAEPGNLWFQGERLIVEWLQRPLDDLVTTQRITLAPTRSVESATRDEHCGRVDPAGGADRCC